ncbi:MAG: PilZ domain-containing protein [Acidobacteriota bacterium]|nr:PilZ domain-containing protein [Acidobacteriota bacterium]
MISISGGAKNLNGTKRSSSIGGHTLDLSDSGLALIVPSIRLGEHHLVGENRSFSVRLELPRGPVEMQVAPVRYEALDQDASESGFLIGVRIISIADKDRAKFGDYVSELLTQKN